MSQIFEGAAYAGITCGKCGVRFFVPVKFDQEQQAAGKKGGFYCPNGHQRVYAESTEDTLRRERDRLKQDQAWYADRLKEEEASRKDAERRASARKGQITRLKNRAAAGVCPCCSRSFENLRRHMDGQHPGFRAEAVA